MSEEIKEELNEEAVAVSTDAVAEPEPVVFAPEPESEAVVFTSAPEPVAEPAPIVFAPAPEPVVESKPEPITAPAPVIESKSEPVVEAVAVPAVELKPEPEPVPVPKPAPPPPKVIPPVEVTTHLNQKAVSTLTKQVFLTNWVVYILFAGIMTLMSGVGIVVWQRGGDTQILGIVILAAGLVIPPVLFIINLFIIQRVGQKTSRITQNTVHAFTLAECITVTESSDSAPTKTNEYGWTVIQKAVEKKDYFFLFLNASSAFILEKAGMTEAGRNDLRELLQIRLSEKFK